jgi:glucan 1,3-beta-glucosidase
LIYFPKGCIVLTIHSFGKLFVGEWGQADTDCTKFLNNVGAGSRWEGTLMPENGPACPNLDSSCVCGYANAHPNKYSSHYRDFLYKFAVAQMDAFEQSWGWMYWTWDTEDAYQWSYKKGMQYNMLPKVAYERDWNCKMEIPDYSGVLPGQ